MNGPKGTQYDNSGSLEFKNCTLASTESEYLTRCSGTCYPQDFQAIHQFVDGSCTTRKYKYDS